jgi:cytochrome c biogenesis protein
VQITEAGEPLQDTVLCAGEYLPVETMPDLVVYFNAFYPDYVMGPSGPMSQSSAVKNPAYLYTVYYQGNVLGMNVLMPEEQLTIDEYTVTFADPQTYTLLQVKKDPLAPAALAGGLITLIGLILALYVQPSGMVAVTEEDGRSHIRAWSRKGGAIFEDRFREVFGEYLNRAAEEGAVSEEVSKEGKDPEAGAVSKEGKDPEEGAVSKEGAVSEEGRHDVSDEEETS